MYKDDGRVLKSYSEAQRLSELLNEGIHKAEILLGKELADHEATEILNGGFPKVMEMLKQQFQFPDSTDEFNLAALGKDKKTELETAKKALAGCTSRFRAYGYEFRNGTVQLTKEGDNAIHEKAKTRTMNHHQDEAFELAKRMVADLNTAFEMGFISIRDANQLERFNRLVKAVHGKGFRVDHRFVSRISENGKVVS